MMKKVMMMKKAEMQEKIERLEGQMKEMFREMRLLKNIWGEQNGSENKL